MNDGGPAFPSDAPFRGMTLRQYYAGLALLGLLAKWSTSTGTALRESLIEDALAYADTLLAQESKET